MLRRSPLSCASNPLKPELQDNRTQEVSRSGTNQCGSTKCIPATASLNDNGLRLKEGSRKLFLHFVHARERCAITSSDSRCACSADIFRPVSTAARRFLPPC